MKFWNTSIRNRMVITLIIFTIIPVALTGLASSWIAARDAQARLENDLGQAVEAKKNQIINWTHNLQVGLNAEVEHDDIRRMYQLLRLEPNTVPFRTVHIQLAEILDDVISNQELFEEFFLIDKYGKIIFSTNRKMEGQNYFFRSLFREGLKGPYVQPPAYEATHRGIYVVVSQPILATDGEVAGVLAGRANMAVLDEIMTAQTGIGQTGETYLINANGLLLTEVDSPNHSPGMAHIRSEGALNVSQTQESGYSSYSNYADIPVLGSYSWIPDLQISVIGEQQQAEAFSTMRSTFNVTLISIGIASLVATLAAIVIGRNLTQPLLNLTQTSEQIAAGDLELRARVRGEDEIGTLARAFNSMTDQLRGLIGSLEQRVSERTSDLQKRARQLQAAADVAREAASIRETEQLLEQATHIISDRFGFYHTGIFLLSDPAVSDSGASIQYAVLRAASSEGGRRMLARQHMLKVGETGIVGYVAKSGAPRIALDVGEDAVYFDNPDMPYTRSEMALPLKVKDQVIGVLDVQSTQPNAFSDEDLSTLEILADQIALAIENARLLAESREAYQEIESLYGLQILQGWQRRLAAQTLGFSLTPTGLQPLEEKTQTSVQRDETETIRVPIEVRGKRFGSLSLGRDKGQGKWSQAEIDLVKETTAQIALALENARLLEEIQNRANQEELINQIVSRSQSSPNLEAVMKTAVQEIGRHFSISKVQIRLSESEKDSQAGAGANNRRSPDGNGSSRSNGGEPGGEGTQQ